MHVSVLCTHLRKQTNETHKKAFPISPAILAVSISAFALQILHPDSSRLYFTTYYQLDIIL